MKIRSLSVSYCVKKKKERQSFKLSLEKDMEQLQKNMDSYPSQKNHDIYNISKKELEQIEKLRIKSRSFIICGIFLGQQMD